MIDVCYIYVTISNNNNVYKLFSYQLIQEIILRNFYNPISWNIDAILVLFCLLRECVIEISGGFLYLVLQLGEKSCNNPSPRGNVGHESTESDFSDPDAPRGTESIAREVRKHHRQVVLCKNGRRRSTEEEKGEGDGVERTVSEKERGSMELGMQFSLVHREGYLTIPRLPKQETGSLGSVGGVNFQCPLSLAIEKSSGQVSTPTRGCTFSLSFFPLTFLCCSDAATTYRRHGKNTWYGILPARSGRDNIFVLRERRATSCLLFRPRSVLSVYSETSASHETVCLPLSLRSLFSVQMRRIFSSCAFRTCLYLSIRLYVSLFPSTYLSFTAIVSLFFPLFLRRPRPHACLRFSFIKLIASTKPKKHVVWGVT